MQHVIAMLNKCKVSNEILRRYLCLLISYVSVIILLATIGILTNLQTPWQLIRPPIPQNEELFTYKFHPIKDGNLTSIRGIHKNVNENSSLLLDGHSHTTFSDGSLTPSLLLDW